MNSILSLSGPSGVGKTTVARALIGDDVRMVESITTRIPRESDISGEYRFLSQREFTTMKERGDFLWEASHGGNRYATVASSVRRVLDNTSCTGLMILTPNVIPTLAGFLATIEGARLVSVFLTVESGEVLKERLILRGDSLDNIALRQSEAAHWESEARLSGTNFHFIDNTGSIAETVGAVRQLL